VVAVVPFGVFVDIAPGKQGLVHVSEYDRVHVPDMTKVAAVRGSCWEVAGKLPGRRGACGGLELGQFWGAWLGPRRVLARRRAPSHGDALGRPWFVLQCRFY
jgi:hypothetical protein